MILHSTWSVPGNNRQLPYNKQVTQHNNLSCALVYFEPLLPNPKQCNQERTMHYIIHLSHTMSTNHNGQPEKDVNPDCIINFFSRICMLINNKINLLLHNNKREDTSQVRTVYDNKYLTPTRGVQKIGGPNHHLPISNKGTITSTVTNLELLFRGMLH